jgi:hypothetical protein
MPFGKPPGVVGDCIGVPEAALAARIGPSLSRLSAIGVGGREGSRLTEGCWDVEGSPRTGGILCFRKADGGTVACDDTVSDASFETFDIRCKDGLIVGEGLNPAAAETDGIQV